MATFIIGGDTGNIGSILAKIFHEHGTPFVVGARDPSRAPGHYKSVAFNWNDPTTFENPFKADPTVDRVYFTAPPAFKPLPIAKPFLDYAVSKGVKRFVFVGASSFKCDANGPLTSPIWHYLANLGLGYVILQPTWFTGGSRLSSVVGGQADSYPPENFFTFHTHTIKNAGYFFSVKEDARIPLVSVKDVAEVAADYLTKEESLDGGLLILGPELLTYDEVRRRSF